MRKQKRSRALAIILSCILLFGLLPTVAFAQEGDLKGNGPSVSSSSGQETDDLGQGTEIVTFGPRGANAVFPKQQTYDKNNFNAVVFTLTTISGELESIQVTGNGINRTLTEQQDYVVYDDQVWLQENVEAELNQLPENQTLTLTFNMSEGNSPVANLTIPEYYAITIETTPAGCGEWYMGGYSNGRDVCYVQAGQEVTLGVILYSGADFLCWKEGEQVVCEDYYYTFTPTADRSLTLVLQPPVSEISVSPEELDFSTVGIDYTSAPEAQTVTVTNVGTTRLNLVQPTAENFQIGQLSEATLAPDESATFTVQPKTGLEQGDYDEEIMVYAYEAPIIARSMFSGSGLTGQVSTTNSVHASFQVGFHYTLTFETNGGSQLADVIEAEGTVVDLAAYQTSKANYEFTGWYMDEALTQKVTSVTLDSSQKVYAGWTEVDSELDPGTEPGDDPGTTPGTDPGSNPGGSGDSANTGGDTNTGSDTNTGTGGNSGTGSSTGTGGASGANSNVNSPKTGDSSGALSVTMLLLGCGAVVGLCVLRRRRQA